MMYEICKTCKTQKSFTKTEIFNKIPKNSVKIIPVRIVEWWYCPICGEVTYSGLCGHIDKKQPFSGTMIRSIIQDKVKPTKLIMRPEVFDMVMEMRINMVLVLLSVLKNT